MERLAGGQHADTWKVTTRGPARTLVLRQFPPDDGAAAAEQRVLAALDGLGGLAPVLLAADPNGDAHGDAHGGAPGDARGGAPGGAPGRPTVVTSWLDGRPDITPTDPDRWASELGRGLVAVHAVPVGGLAGLPSVFERDRPDALAGPAAAFVSAGWPEIAAAASVLTHRDYWSGNVVWRHGALSGIVDWSGASLGPRGFDIGWCRLDLYLLAGELPADVFLDAYQDATGGALGDVTIWDAWAVARSHDMVQTWLPNYEQLGRVDLDAEALRRGHAAWTQRILSRARRG